MLPMMLGLESINMMVRHDTVSEYGESMFSGASSKSTGTAPDTDCKWNTMLGTIVLAVVLVVSKHTVDALLLTVGKLN
jgi:hypothetical protein